MFILQKKKKKKKSKGHRNLRGVMDMLVPLTVAMASRVPAYVRINKNVYIKCVPFLHIKYIKAEKNKQGIER